METWVASYVVVTVIAAFVLVTTPLEQCPTPQQHACDILNQSINDTRTCDRASGKLIWGNNRTPTTFLLCCLGVIASKKVTFNYTDYLNVSLVNYTITVATENDSVQIACYVKNCHSRVSSTGHKLTKTGYLKYVNDNVCMP